MIIHEHLVGRVKDADNAPRAYRFIAPAPSPQLTTGEYVTCEVQLGERTELIYGRINHRRTINPYPNAFFLNPIIDPATIAETSGCQHGNLPLLEITVTIIGYFDDLLKEFVNPRIGPISGTPVYLATSRELRRLFNKTVFHYYDQLFIGDFPNRNAVLALDTATLARTHVAILSGTGAREAHFMMHLIDSTFEFNAHAATLLIDTRNKYTMMVNALDPHTDKASHRYPNITEYPLYDVKIHISILSLDEIKSLLPALQREEAQLLQEAFYGVQQESQKEYGNTFQWTLSQLTKRISDLSQLRIDNNVSIKEQDYVAGNLRTYLHNLLEEAFIAKDEDSLPSRELFIPDQCSVLGLNGIDITRQRVLVSSLLRRLLWRRTQTFRRLWRQRRDSQKSFQIPEPPGLHYPVVIILAEAHRFAPETGEAVSSAIIKEIMDTGHELGVGMMILSQQPSKLDGDVIAQCNTHCLLQIVNERDQQWVAENVRTVGQELLDELPTLGRGHVILAGEAVRAPVIFKMYTADIPFGETSKNDPAEWNSYLEEKNRKQRSTKEHDMVQ